MSIDLSTRVTTDVVSSVNQSKRIVSPSNADVPAVDLVGSGRQPDATNGGQVLPVNAGNKPAAVDEASELSQAVSRMSDHVQNIRRGLEFTIDEELNRTVITVYDVESEEVIRQIPSEEFLELVRHFNEMGSASLISEKA